MSDVWPGRRVMVTRGGGFLGKKVVDDWQTAEPRKSSCRAAPPTT